MKYIFLALLITFSPVLAMQENTFSKNEKVMVAAAVAGHTIGHAVFGPSVIFSPIPVTIGAALSPIIMPVVAGAAISMAVYGSYKSGEYLYKRYTGSANLQQS